MKKDVRIIIIILLAYCISISCERDDLCPQDIPITPQRY